MRRDRLLRNLLRERFVVTLKTGDTFDGLLDEWDTSHVAFVDAYAVTPTTRQVVDGHLYLPRGEIAYMQRPSSA